MSLARKQTVFFTGSFLSDGPESKPAIIEQNFNVPYIKDASQWLIAVERFELNLNGIPFFEGGGVVEFINAGGVIIETLNIGITFSLLDLIRLINEQRSPIAGPPSFGFEIGINTDGFIQVVFDDFITFSIVFSDNLNRILGVNENVALAIGIPGFTIIKSSTPRLDCGDFLQIVTLTSNLPLVSDNIGQVKTNVLTDFAAPEVLGASVNLVETAQGVSQLTTGGSIGYSPRQKIIFTPQGPRRFLNVVGSFPLSSIRIQANFKTINGEIRPVLLPVGCIFSIKLGFHLRS